MQRLIIGKKSAEFLQCILQFTFHGMNSSSKNSIVQRLIIGNMVAEFLQFTFHGMNSSSRKYYCETVDHWKDVC